VVFAALRWSVSRIIARGGERGGALPFSVNVITTQQHALLIRPQDAVIDSDHGGGGCVCAKVLREDGRGVSGF